MTLLCINPPAETIQHGNDFPGRGQELILRLLLAEAEISAGQTDTVKENVQLPILRDGTTAVLLIASINLLNLLQFVLTFPNLVIRL